MALPPDATRGLHIHRIAQCLVLPLTVLMVWRESSRDFPTAKRTRSDITRTVMLGEFLLFDLERGTDVLADDRPINVRKPQPPASRTVLTDPSPKVSRLRINLFQHLAHIIQSLANHMNDITFPLQPTGGHHHSRKSCGLPKVLPD